MSTEAMKLALEAHHKNERHNSVAETNYWCNQYKLLAHQAIEALAKQEQGEPVGKFAKFTDNIWREVTDGSAGVPLYTTPQQREWVWLKDEEIWSLITRIGSGNSDVNPLTILADVRAVEFRIHMKNSDVKQEPQRTEQEPVKIVQYNCTCGRKMKFESEHGVIAPQRTWVGLTDEETETLIHRFDGDPHTLLDEVDARLKGKNT
jgi:hypothetical protein